jgi:hypothetical protein
MRRDRQMSQDLIQPTSILVTKYPRLGYRHFNLTDHPGLPLKNWFHESEVFQVFPFVLVPGIRTAGGVLVLL